ncbi:hypothetical protein SAMN05519103_04827 [Rhizobiales bacterium GAS113]|nr:hypothetical protein SAMN05519103_04827 [Rhizobiales bacterium GAS113]
MRGGLHFVAWSGWARRPLFWLIVAATVAVVAWVNPTLSIATLIEGCQGLLAGTTGPARTEAFAYALALLITAVALGVALAVFILHVGCVVFSLKRVLRIVEARPDKRSFAADFDTVYDQLTRHPLIGHAFAEFSETLERPIDGGVIKSTMRPQSFFTMAMLRERLPGLKYLSAVPGYFVGIGLFFTFIGLVFALGEASRAVEATDSAAMTGAVGKLLTAATFKFSTSIAGLGASIALSMAFKSATISIEEALSRLCEALEKRLVHLTQQTIAVQMNQELAEQTTQLKTLASDQFISRFGDAVALKLADATLNAMTPVTETLREAIETLRAKSTDGMTELVSSFSDSLRTGAGVEMHAVAASIRQMGETLTALQTKLDGSGEVFAQRMSEATVELTRAAAEAGLAATAVQADVAKGFSEATSALNYGASAAAKRFETDAIDAGNKASADLQSAMASTVARLRDEVERINAGLLMVRETFTANAEGLRASAIQSQDAARAFGTAAEDLRGATSPLAQSTRTIAEAAARIDTGLAASVASLADSNTAARTLANELTGHQSSLADSWQSYSARFAKVDEDLQRAVEALGRATGDQISKLTRFVSDIDESLEKTLKQLNAPLTGLEGTIGELSDNVAKLLAASRK